MFGITNLKILLVELGMGLDDFELLWKLDLNPVKYEDRQVNCWSVLIHSNTLPSLFESQI